MPTTEQASAAAGMQGCRSPVTAVLVGKDVSMLTAQQPLPHLWVAFGFCARGAATFRHRQCVGAAAQGAGCCVKCCG